MRSFDDTSAAQIGDEEYEGRSFGETNWLPPTEAMKGNLHCLSANFGHNNFGQKVYVHWIIEGDPDAVEYTTSFSDKSKVWDQVKALLDQEAAGEDAFPFLCSVAMVGKTYKLIGPMYQPAPTIANHAGPERKPTAARPAPPVGRRGDATHIP